MKRRKTRLFPATFSHAGASSYRTAISSCFSFFASLGHSAGQIASRRVVFWTCVGRPFTHLYPSGGLMLEIWKRAGPIHSSEGKNYLSRHSIPIIVRCVLGCVITTGSRLPHAIGSMHFVMVISEITTHDLKSIYRFLLRKMVSSSSSSSSLSSVSRDGHFAAWGLRKIEEFQKIHLHMETTAFLLERLPGA